WITFDRKILSPMNRLAILLLGESFVVEIQARGTRAPRPQHRVTRAEVRPPSHERGFVPGSTAAASPTLGNRHRPLDGRTRQNRSRGARQNDAWGNCMTTAAALTPWSILAATAGLIAFHIGLYTLVGRERKSPYV